MSDEFQFDINARRNRLSDAELMAALQAAAESLGEGYFSSPQYDNLSGKRPHSATIIERFGSWKKALAIIGIVGGRERRHTPEALIANLESIWKQLGYPPGKRQISTLGERISESPYKRHWGSVRAACECISAFHNGILSKEKLYIGVTKIQTRTTISLKNRWDVLKINNYKCVKCGASPSSNHDVILEIDHIIPVSRGGNNSIDNLQTLCRDCNQGKKDR